MNRPIEQFFVIANRKAQGLACDIKQFFAEFFQLSSPMMREEIKVIFALPFPYLRLIHPSICKIHKIAIGAQTVSPYPEGLYTGEVSATMLQDCCIRYALVGHCERRQFQKETAILLHQQLYRLQQSDIRPILCLGENEADPCSDAHSFQELLSLLRPLKLAYRQKILIAYEPSANIGKSMQVPLEKIVPCIDKLREILNREFRHDFPILYGGSVTPESIKTLMQTLPIQGVLIGRSALSAQTLYEILNNIRPYITVS